MRRAGVTILVLVLSVWGRAATRREAAVAVATVQVEGVHLEQTSRCAKGGALRVTASESHLSLLGDCTEVIIEGSSNWIQVEHARRLVMRGDRNTVLYQDRSTRVEDRGKANSVAEKWPQ